ncbi:dynein regulatory complex subunit 7 [Cebidichthys violaceus]|uniref:dynein regulatory complex subunit 7 n=1 Tax=Cebidichthys violaceus TaxID=271503 RepID=UPI0035C96E7D
MESVPESDGEEQEVRRGETLQEEEEEDEEEPQHVSAPEELLLKLNTTDQLCPESYRMNSPDERRLLDIADNFHRQYSLLYPDRKPLLLCPTNECGVKKFVSTTLRPTATEHPELFTWPGCASFVADFLSLEPLEPPVNLPSFLLSSSLVLQSRRATCLDFASLLCSLLLGVNYDAYCVSGYAVREMCLLDRSRLRCPLLDTQAKSEIHEQEPQENKYSVKPPKEPKSQFLIHQEEKKKKQQQEEEEATLLQKQKLQEESEQRPADPLRGLRVHCWVLVLSGSRSVPENFFIDPLTGNRYATDDERFLGVESAWNNFNYYVNMQDCRNGCADMVYDLEDLKTWEPVLYGGTSKKQLMLDVLKKKKTMSKVINAQEEEEEEEKPRVFEMPRSWVSYINISREDLESRWPGRQKVTHYRRAKLEQFAPYLKSDGLVQRLTAYQDLDCTDEVSVKEWYQHRDDNLEETEVNKLDSVTTERFTRGRPFHLLFHRFWSRGDDEREMLFSSGHRDDLVRRLVSPGEMTETFEGRSDFLFYRHVVAQRTVRFSGPYPVEQLNVRQLEKVVERFHRNRSKPANADVAERVFLLAERRIEVTYHLDDHRTIGSKRSFIKPEEATETKKAEDFRAQLVSGYQVDPSEEPLHTLTLNKMLVDLMKDEEEVILQIKTSWIEVSDFLASRAEEKRDVRLPFSPWTTTGAAKARSHRQEMERQAEEDQSWLQERKKDILAPLLIRLDNAETLSAKDAKQLYHDCLAECKQRLVEKANLIQKHYDKETQELQRKQQWYQEKQLTIAPQDKDEYQNYCSEKTLRIRVAKKRLSMHMEAAPLEYQNLDLKLKNDPRLAPHLLK